MKIKCLKCEHMNALEAKKVILKSASKYHDNALKLLNKSSKSENKTSEAIKKTCWIIWGDANIALQKARNDCVILENQIMRYENENRMSEM